MHPLLLRQLKRHFGSAAAVPPELRAFVDAVDAAYANADRDRQTLERSLDQSSSEMLERNRRAEAKSVGILRAFPELVLFVDAKDVVLDARTPWPQALRRPATQCIGESVHEVLDPEGAMGAWLADSLEQARATGATDVVEFADTWPGDERRELEMRVAPVDDGEALVLVRDITERKRAERALQESQERYELAVSGSHDGLWDWDVRGGKVYLTPRFAKLLGMREGGTHDFSATFEALLHPDDSTRVANALSAHLQHAVPFDETARLRHSDGAWRWFQLRGQAHRDIDGLPLRMAGSIRDISDLKAKEAELERARDAAETANRAKDDFLANVSHEIRTPMNAILGLSHLLASGELRPRERAYAEGMLEAGRSLLALINDLLDVTRIESHDITLAPMTFDLRTSLRELFGQHEKRAQAKGVSTRLQLAPDLPDRVFADPGRLRQLLHNLLDNAVKFTPRGTVALEVRAGGKDEPPDTVHFSVRDTGIGIPHDRLGELGKKFTQLDARSTRRHGGTGIGLAITNHLVQLMGGHLSIDSHEGSGSCFTVTLRLPARCDDQSVRTRLAPPEILTGLRVLAVSDETGALERLRDELVSTFVVESVATIGEALDRLEAGAALDRPFDIVVFYDRTTAQESEAALRTIARDPRLRDTVAGVVVALGAVGDAARLAGAGAAFYLTLPIAAGDVRDAIAAAWEAKRVRREPVLVTRHTLAEERSRGGAPTRIDVSPGSTRRPTPVTPMEATPMRGEASGTVGAATTDGSDRSSAPHILVVDDNEINRAVASEMLQRLGYRVSTADGGEEGARRAIAEPFDLVLMDVQMPGVDGHEATIRIRQAEGGTSRRTPIIAVTANAMPADRERTVRAGMDDFLPKPISRPRLQEMAERWVRRARVAPSAEGAEPSGESSAGSILDVSQLRSIVGDDPVRIREFVALFLQVTEPLLDTLRNAVTARDFAEARRQAHKLKGSCGSAGARTMATLAATAERVADVGGDAALDETAEALVRAFDDVKRVARDLSQPRAGLAATSMRTTA